MNLSSYVQGHSDTHLRTCVADSDLHYGGVLYRKICSGMEKDEVTIGRGKSKQPCVNERNIELNAPHDEYMPF